MSILAMISRLEILTRSQIQSIFDIRGTRNANRIMKSLNQYVGNVFVGQNAYFLNKRGLELLGTNNQYRHSNQITHKLMRNDAYIYFKPTEWWPEQEVEVGKVKVNPDAFLYSGSSYKFLEVDNMQRWYINKQKFENYKRLHRTGAFQKKYGKFPTLLWVVKYESRKPKLKELAEEYDLFCEVYTNEEVII